MSPVCRRPWPVGPRSGPRAPPPARSPGRAAARHWPTPSYFGCWPRRSEDPPLHPPPPILSPPPPQPPLWSRAAPHPFRRCSCI